MRRIVLAMLLTVGNVIVAQAHGPVRRVLFIGNSITYVNDLPSAFASLATRGTPVEVDMIASAGASLADVANRPLVKRALAEGGYTDVVLQERGGEAFCPSTCQKDPSTILPAMQSAGEVSRQARASGARVFYLGTWQSSQETNDALEFGERAVAKAIGATYIDIAEPRRKLMLSHPDMAWTHADGEHPGYATTAMMALRTWRAIFQVMPTAAPCVAGEVHYHAPKAEGLWHVDTTLRPRTCLVAADAVPALAGHANRMNRP